MLHLDFTLLQLVVKLLQFYLHNYGTIVVFCVLLTQSTSDVHSDYYLSGFSVFFKYFSSIVFTIKLNEKIQGEQGRWHIQCYT